MTIKEIFDTFEKIGCLTFTTIDKEYPVSRIAHFFTYDDCGLYFFTMKSKPFYKQLKQTGKLSVCGMLADTQVSWMDENSPHSPPGFFIRATGDVREFTIDDAKTKNDPRFDYLIYDNSRYPLITGFCLYNFHGEVYDYDFEKEHRDHKLERVRFSFGGMTAEKAGLLLDGKECTSCGKCEEICTFSAISKGEDAYIIDSSRCDECGNCYNACPVGAIAHKGI